MKEITDKTLLTLLVISIVVSVGGTFMSLSKLSGVPAASITGAAISPNASATLTVQSAASLTFSQSAAAFGTGSVNTSGGFTNCTLSTNSGYEGCQNFNQLSAPFTLENDGNTNLTVELFSNVTAAQFIGGSGPVFQYNVSVNETGSCYNSTTEENSTPVPATFTTVNTTDPGTVICPKLLFNNIWDTLNIDINITIPENAPQNAKSAGLKATGTTV